VRGCPSSGGQHCWPTLFDETANTVHSQGAETAVVSILFNSMRDGLLAAALSVTVQAFA
jgi:hypothetical protein